VNLRFLFGFEGHIHFEVVGSWNTLVTQSRSAVVPGGFFIVHVAARWTLSVMVVFPTWAAFGCQALTQTLIQSWNGNNKNQPARTYELEPGDLLMYLLMQLNLPYSIPQNTAL
jgi:hypothetical protein